MDLSIKDSEGEQVVAGDTVSFGYGIPPTGVRAAVIQRGDKLIALTPGHKPPECELKELIRLVGYVQKVRPPKPKKVEIEARLFHSKRSTHD